MPGEGLLFIVVILIIGTPVTTMIVFVVIIIVTITMITILSKAVTVAGELEVAGIFARVIVEQLVKTKIVRILNLS
jgi:hypothetical protein